MIQTTLEILSAAIGCMCTESQLMGNIDCVMTDSTSHNLGVTELVSEEVESEYVPSSLVCNIHLLMMIKQVVSSHP